MPEIFGLDESIAHSSIVLRSDLTITVDEKEKDSVCVCVCV